MLGPFKEERLIAAAEKLATALADIANVKTNNNDVEKSLENKTNDQIANGLQNIAEALNRIGAAMERGNSWNRYKG